MISFDRNIAKWVIKSVAQIAFLLSFMLMCLTGCKYASRTWQTDCIETSTTPPCSQLYLSPENSFRNLEIVIQDEDQENTVYLNIYGTPLTADASGAYPVLIKIEETEQIIEGYLLAGGQRIVLPKAAQKKLLEALYEQRSITIKAGRYSTEVHYEGFDSTLIRYK